MAPPPEYDKEPKAPDKSAATISCEETKTLHNLVNDQQTNSDNKSASTPANTEVENNKHVETLDDGQLRALLDEAITYKCPKDREGKSSLFKELLEEVEQDEQACEAAARGACGTTGRRTRGGTRSRRALPHSNSLQDLVAALAAEPAPRRRHAPPPAPPVSARAIHGGSLPSGVDTSFLLGEEPPARAGYLATVRCVNPPPLAERRVSTSDAHPPDLDLPNRRSKPAFPMTYTARATLEIGSGSVSSGRAVTTTTASNQVRTLPTAGPPERLFHKTTRLYNYKKPPFRSPKPPRRPKEIRAKTSETKYFARKDETQVPKDDAVTVPVVEDIDSNQYKLLRALLPKTNCDLDNNGGGSKVSVNKSEVASTDTGKNELPRGPLLDLHPDVQVKPYHNRKYAIEDQKPLKSSASSEIWMNNVNQWYQGLEDYTRVTIPAKTNVSYQEEKSLYQTLHQDDSVPIPTPLTAQTFYRSQVPKYNRTAKTPSDRSHQKVSSNDDLFSWTQYYSKSKPSDASFPSQSSSYLKKPQSNVNNKPEYIPPRNMFAKRNVMHEKSSPWGIDDDNVSKSSESSDNSDMNISRQQYRNRIGRDLELPSISINPRNIRSMTIGQSLPNNDTIDKPACVDKSGTDMDKIGNKENVPNALDNNTSSEVDIQPVTYQDFVDLSSTETEQLKDTEEVDNKLSPKRDMNLSDRSSTPIAEQSDGIDDGSEILNEVTIVNEQDAGTSSQTSLAIAQDADNTSTNVQDEKGTVDISVDSKSDYVTNLGEEFKQSFFSYSRDNDPSCEQGTELETFSRSEEKSLELINICKDFRDKEVSFDCENDVELADMSSRGSDGKQITEEDQKVLLHVNTNDRHEDTSFASYLASQQKLLQVLEDSNLVDSAQEHSLISFLDNSEKVQQSINDIKLSECVSEHVGETSNKESQENVPNVDESLTYEDCSNSVISGPPEEVVMRLDQSMVGTLAGEVDAHADLPNNAYVFLTLPQRLLSHLHNKDNTDQLRIEHHNDKPNLSGGSNAKKKKKRDLPLETTKVKEVTINKNALRALLFENLFKSDSADKSQSKQLSTITTREVDSAIPFSCITSPEVVASCNTTSSNAQSAVAVDPKPRSVINVSSLNGLPLSRPNYGSTGSTTQDEFKKSLDENGNSVQGFSSPLSGSSQHKKPRRKKSSKNETVIKSHQIDGYQGNKDLNEVLRFIESNADTSRAHKLGRAKHKDDADDKGGKKRSTERRKDKESKMKRASSLEELSRTTLEDLTDKPPKKERRADAAPKQERRSWGDDARPAFLYEPDPPAPDADFQTVTKKRKPRRRPDEPERSPGDAEPAAAAPPPRPRRVSAPPSDRSNDSNDDLDSVHSLPADAPAARAPPAPASYADIARTRHNIPDLIESCNFYAEGEPRAAEPPPPAPSDADGYPALEPRAPRRPAPPAKPAQPAQPTQPTQPPRNTHRKQERLETMAGAECPAPDVVSDRRPPVILLDSASRPRDMDGVTFGFDINEQLLGGPTRRPRCDLVRDAIEGGTTATIVEANGVTPGVTTLPGVTTIPGVTVVPGVTAVGGVGVCVVGGCALRYVPPAPPPDTHHLHQIIDYVGAAWEDVVRCGGGKVRYFSE